MKKRKRWIIGGVLLVIAVWFAFADFLAREEARDAERAREAAAWLMEQEAKRRMAAVQGARTPAQVKQDAQRRSQIFALFASIERDDAVLDQLDANPSPARAHAVYVSLARKFAAVLKLAEGFHGPMDDETRSRVEAARGRLPTLRYLIGEMTDPVERERFEAYFRALATPE